MLSNLPGAAFATIAAIATAPGQGGIGIVRISGSQALHILQCLFRPSRDRASFAFVPRMLHHGWVHTWQDGARREPLDEALAVYMPGPNTVTGEDVAEIHCHGSPVILAAVLEAAMAAGAKAAERGEFTYRALHHGKIDLTQAEAVAELIASPARQGLCFSLAKLAGLFGERIRMLRMHVEDLRARVALAVDFPEDEGECLDLPVFAAVLDEARRSMRALLATYKRARLWQEGVLVVMAGRVNVGKSSLLNALLGRERAIVSPNPGTTRDFIEEALDIDGLRVRLADTAGLRASEDSIEQEGVSRSHALAMEADLILMVTEAGCNLDIEEAAFLKQHEAKVLHVLNKADMLLEQQRRDLDAKRTLSGVPCVLVSATTGFGLEFLAEQVRHHVLRRETGMSVEPSSGDVAPNLRQSQCLRLALEEADSLTEDIQAGMGCDLFSVRLDGMAAHLDEITGYAASDAVLEQIFSRFCVGK